MRLERISIRSYKAIDDISIRFNKRLIPIVGVNEAGKTTILEALLAFSPFNDDYADGSHLDPTNIYTGMSNAEITAEIILEDGNDLTDIRDNPNRATEVDKIVHTLNTALNQDTSARSLLLTRHLPNLGYSFTSPVEAVPSGRGHYGTHPFIDRVLDRLPSLIYFENFIDKFPARIEFLRENQKIQNTSLSIWHHVIREMFERAEIDFDDYLDRVEVESDPGYENLTTHDEDKDRVEEYLNDILAKEWIFISSNGSRAVPYRVHLRHTLQGTHEGEEINRYQHVFRLRIVDALDEDQRGSFSVEQRSKGYQWFCNFILKLTFNPQYAETQEEAIFLLDEPGAYLHPLAQEGLLDKLTEISQTNTIVYATHLPQLVNPSKIRLNDCMVAFRDGNQIALKRYGEMGDSQSFGALTTLHNAMQLSLPGFIFPNSPTPFAITEGITDFYVFSMVKQYTQLLADFDVSFVPGHGVNQLDDLISLAIAWCDRYVVIFDKDQQADDAIIQYEERFGEQQRQNHWIQIDNQQNDEKVVLGNLFSANDTEQLLQITETKKLKRAYELLYFAGNDEIAEFWSNIDDETEGNFALVAEMIAEVINGD